MNDDAVAVADSDEAAMTAYAAGDVQAFARLYDRHARPVRRYFVRHAVPSAEADELLQETWMAVVRHAPDYTVQARFTTWLYTIARSRLVDHWRAQRRRVPLDDAANDDGFDDSSPIERIADPAAVAPDVRAMSREQAAAFLAAVDALPPAQRDAFLLHVDGDLSVAAVAEVTGVGAETAKTRLRYAMKRLRAACADWLGPPVPTRANDGARDEA